jgi:CheY-like chemotaxis protein
VRLAPGQGEQRVLIVEDNRDNRLLLQNLLKPVGFSVHEATNGAEALAVFQEWQPHFIWMDIRMPIMDGCEATRRIRALPGGEAVKIVALTASAFKEQRRRIQEAGCDEVLCKPFRPPEIFKSMKEHLKLRYIYDKEAQEDEQVAPSTPLTAAMTTELPDEQKKALRVAAQKLDISATEEVLKEIRNEHPEIAGRLQVLVREFRFSRILELFKSEKEQVKE